MLCALAAMRVITILAPWQPAEMALWRTPFGPRHISNPQKSIDTNCGLSDTLFNNNNNNNNSNNNNNNNNNKKNHKNGKAKSQQARGPFLIVEIVDASILLQFSLNP